MVVDTAGVWREFSQRLRQFIRRRVEDEQDAEDILQTVFYRIHSRIEQLEDEKKLHGWVFQIARNAIIDYYRQRRRLAPLPERSEVPSEATKQDVIARTEITDCLEPIIAELPEPYRQAILLTDFGNLTQRQLADHLGLSLSGVKSRVQRARQKVKEMLLACCHFELDRLGGIVDYRLKEPSCRFCAEETRPG